MAVVISDASPLVHLSAIRRFELLKELYPSLLDPPAVWTEVTVAGRGRPGAFELTTAVERGWISMKIPNPSTLGIEALRGLDLGEAEALALALDTKAGLIIMDELKGRAVARALRVPAKGTLGVLIDAKARGLIASLRDELIRLRQDSQLQLTSELEQLALTLAGEG